MIDMSDFVLRASLIPGIGSRTIALITNNYLDQITDFDALTIHDFMLRGVNKERSSDLYYGLKEKNNVSDEYKLMKEHSASFLTPYSIDYPSELKRQEVFPSVLYQQKKANTVLFNETIFLSMVSSRETNLYGRRVIYKLIEEIANYNITIVSGGAVGGDTFIHEAALANNLKTIVVLGSGLANWYPRNNKILFQKIIDKGGIIMSHFAMNTIANKLTFPVRNSVIAGISQGLLVIQAGLKSGTLITANYALEYGKEVGAVPGYIDDLVMIESNNLIKQGAYCITSGEDVLKMLNIKLINNIILKEKINYSDCNEEEKKIILLCQEGLFFEELQIETKIDINTLYSILFKLLEKNYLLQDSLGKWIVKK